MRIRKYDFDYGRRKLMENVISGAAAGGVLAPLWPVIASAGSTTKAYPEELIHIEAATKGKIKVGDYITADNVQYAEHLMDPIQVIEVKTMGRRFKIMQASTEVTDLFPSAYYEATVRNFGKGRFDADGNVLADDGGPWIGGNPFPVPKTGLEAMANITLSWGRHDLSRYAVRDFDLSPDGDISYRYDFVWNELNTTARTGKERYFQGKKDLLRYQGIFFTDPQDTAGSAFLCPWYYDQRKFPDLYGYLPAFKRVRQFPTNQRFEPLVPGLTFFLSDAWGAGDPMLTWGNYRIVGREPHLVPLKGNWNGARHPNWEPKVHGGPKNQTFFDTCMELVPECIVVEAEPSGYPRAPIGKKRLWLDARNTMFAGMNTYDRRGQLWKSVDAAFGQRIDGNVVVRDRAGHPDWSWTHVTCHDIQTNRLSRFYHAKAVTGGYTSDLRDTDEVGAYNRFLTVSAIQRLGSA